MAEDREKKDKILIVDDVPKNIQVVANILQGRGYSMAFAQDGPTAIEMAKKTPFDLILMDIMMPEMDGIEACRILGGTPETAAIPVLFLTAKTDTESVVAGLEAGAMDYVIKPVNDAELLARVNTHLSLHRHRRSLVEINRKLKQESEERRKAVEKYQSMYENAVQGMFQSTISGRMLATNPAYARILGYVSPDELIRLENVGHVLYEKPEDRELMLEDLRENGVLTNYELKIKRKNGDSAWLMINARLGETPEGEPVIEGVAVDHTARKQAEDKLRRSRETFRYQATHDNLTKLYNTRYLYSALERMVCECGKAGRAFSLIFLDVDNFKEVVDTYGHLKGSKTLQEFADTIQSCIEEPAFAVAYGGDEFVVVLPDTDTGAAVAMADVIRRRVRERAYLTSHGHEIHISASFGVAAFPRDARDVNGLLGLADQAMFNVKSRGKDAVRAIGTPSSPG
ncbi:MAG: hypothetical protein CSB33_02165 [Desulfobacterales bacterium]|nr:MAG: hypothetical protein CSB33_02165 [Desulfobacterales bacterium]